VDSIGLLVYAEGLLAFLESLQPHHKFVNTRWSVHWSVFGPSATELRLMRLLGLAM
jgi:hypothetical protein